ncbi:MAG: hypothetical protein ACPGU7_11780 [Gammaproteobacteria bacterium]
MNDPFCRVEKRRERGYNAVRGALEANGVDTVEAAEGVRDSMKRNAWIVAAVVLAVGAVMSLVFPSLTGLFAVIVVAAWLAVMNTALNGQRHVKRYIAEELVDRD